jgi:hypothetical protein
MTTSALSIGRLAVKSVGVGSEANAGKLNRDNKTVT